MYGFQTCDLIDNCGDNSDEEGCEYNVCKPWQFLCDNHKCIPAGKSIHQSFCQLSTSQSSIFSDFFCCCKFCFSKSCHLSVKGHGHKLCASPLRPYVRLSGIYLVVCSLDATRKNFIVVINRMHTCYKKVVSQYTNYALYIFQMANEIIFFQI